jgi:hypothetical protein
MLGCIVILFLGRVMFLRYRVLGNLPGEEEFGFGERTSFYRAYIQFTEEFNCWVCAILPLTYYYTRRDLSLNLFHLAAQRGTYVSA